MDMKEKIQLTKKFINNLKDPMHSTSFIDFRERVVNQVLKDLNNINENNQFLHFESGVIKTKINNYLNRFLVSTFKMSESNLINHIRQLHEINERINIPRKDLEKLFETNEIEETHIKSK